MNTPQRPHAIVTGATSAIGQHVVAELVNQGYSVTIAARVVEHAHATAGRISGIHPDADITVHECDLSSLESVRAFCEEVNSRGRSWDVLLQTATAQLVPQRMLTDDGFEWNFGVNYLANFAMTGLLQKTATANARVITTTSPTANSATLKFYDLRWDNGYRPGRAFATSRLATLIQSVEYARRITAGGSAMRAIVTHPGFIQERPRLGRTAALAERVMGHSAQAGAQIAIYATTADLPNGSFVTPSGPGQLRGGPTMSPIPNVATNLDTATRLWRVSEQLTGVSW